MVLVALSRRRPLKLVVPRRLFSSPAPQSEKPPSIATRLWTAYSDSLYKRPLATKCTAAALIFFTSDSVTQYITCEDDDDYIWDSWRATSGAIFGVVATTYLHVWWGALEVIGEKIVSQARSKVAHTAIKVFFDQAIGAPIYIYSYYTITNFLQTVGQTGPQAAWNDSTGKANEMLWDTMLRHWRLWPVVHSINFYYVPLQHRVLVQNLVLVGWSGCKF